MGIFDSFDNLDQLSVEAVASWLRSPPQLTQLENYLANRILYPQVLPLTEYDMQVDLAILREALRTNNPKPGLRKMNALLGDNPFINYTLRKILIPSRFLNFVPNLMTLAGVFIDALLLNREKGDWFQDLWTIVLTGDTDEIVGSILLPQFDNNGGTIDLKVLSKNYEVRFGNFLIIPCLKNRCEIAYKFRSGKILGKSESAIEVYGGRLGLVIDGRDR